MDNLKQLTQLASKQEIIILISICGIQIFQSALCFSAIPFLFEVPVFQCHSKITNQDFICSENLACSEYSNSFKIISNQSSKSLTAEFFLFCTKRFDKALIQTLIILGQGITCFFFSFFQINAKYRKNIMFAAEIAYLLFSILSYFATSIQPISILLFLIQISYQTFYINVYTYINENFSPQIKQVSTLLVSISWGLSTFFFPIAYYFIQDWRKTLFFYTIIPSIFLIIFIDYAFYHNHLPTSNSLEIQDKFYSFKAIFEQKTVKKNFLFFTLIASIQYLCFTGVNLAQDTIYGGLYFNMILFGFLEIFAGFINIKIIHLFEEKKQIKYFCIFNAFNYLMFILQPKESTSSFLQIFFIIFNLFGKLGFEMCWNVLLVYISKLVPAYLNQVFFAMMLSMVNIISPIVPYYIETSKYLEISPFIGFGILYTLSFFLSDHLKEYQKQIDKEQDIEMKEIDFIDNGQKKQDLRETLIFQQSYNEKAQNNIDVINHVTDLQFEYQEKQ